MRSGNTSNWWELFLGFSILHLKYSIGTQHTHTHTQLHVFVGLALCRWYAWACSYLLLLLLLILLSIDVHTHYLIQWFSLSLSLLFTTELFSLHFFILGIQKKKNRIQKQKSKQVSKLKKWKCLYDASISVLLFVSCPFSLASNCLLCFYF